MFHRRVFFFVKMNMYQTNNDLIGTAKTLERAMKVNRSSEMLDCFKDMKLYASTIEKDLSDYLNTTYANKTSETNDIQWQPDDFLQLAKQQHLHNHPYILLNDLIETKRVRIFHLQIISISFRI